MRPGKRGIIVKWFDEKGYGFIEPVTRDAQLFFHIRSIRNSARRDLLDQRVTYHEGIGKDGRPAAVEVYLASEGATPIKDSANRRRRSRLRSSAITAWVITLIFLTATAAAAMAGALPFYIPLVYAGMSLLTFIVYSDDKEKAGTGSWRTPESTLHCLELFGGWPGALAAQWHLPHKNRKHSFQVLFWMIVMINMVLFGVVIAQSKRIAPGTWTFASPQSHEERSRNPTRVVIEFPEEN